MVGLMVAIYSKFYSTNQLLIGIIFLVCKCEFDKQTNCKISGWILYGFFKTQFYFAQLEKWNNEALKG